MAVKNFSFAVPCLPAGNNIDELSFDSWLDLELTDEILPSFPAKSLKKIISLIQNSRCNKINTFEWLGALECQSEWDELSQNELESACIAVWSSIVCNQTLGDIALFKIALALDGRTSTIVSQLVDSVFIARKVSELDEFVKQKLDWLLLLHKSDYIKLAKYCYELNKTVDDTIRWLRMPQVNNYSIKLKGVLSEIIPKQDIDDFDDKWLASNFLALHTSQQRITFLEQFICWFKNVEYGKYCLKFVEQYCLPTQENNYWTRLNLEAQRLVKKKFNLSSYFELYAISSALYSDEASQELNLTDIEKRQIRSRSMFWSNYSSKFNRVRVLLPDNTFKFIVKRNGDVPSFVTSFNQQVNNECEVYIFELEKIIAVEFLRGALSETRFFTRNDWNSQRLFDSEALSANDIRSMSQQEVHDHLPCWQYFCERLLRIKFKITPNMNIPHFKGLPPDINRYVEGVGLPTPSKVMMAERRQGLENWVEKFWSIEAQTGKFGKQGYSNDKSQLYLAKALMAKQMGDQLEFEQFMTKAAELGSSEAMWQLGKLMLLNPRSDAKTKKLGEEWIAKSSGMGHQNATEICKRYGFKPIVQELSPLDEYDSKNSKEEILNCINLLESVSEIEQHKGLILAKHLIQNPLFSSHITDALLSLINLSRNTLIRRDATKLLRTYGDERILWELAIELGRDIPSEQEEAIRIYSSLARKNSDEAILEIRKLVDFAKEYERQSVLLVGLKTLENLGDTDTLYRLYEEVANKTDSNSIELARALLSISIRTANNKPTKATNIKNNEINIGKLINDCFYSKSFKESLRKYFYEQKDVLEYIYLENNIDNTEVLDVDSQLLSIECLNADLVQDLSMFNLKFSLDENISANIAFSTSAKINYSCRLDDYNSLKSSKSRNIDFKSMDDYAYCELVETIFAKFTGEINVTLSEVEKCELIKSLQSNYVNEYLLSKIEIDINSANLIKTLK